MTENHYLATLGIYLQFHDFQSFSKKITEKILTAGFYNWWYQYVRKFIYFPNNIPKNICGGGKTVKKFENPPFFIFFYFFFNETSERGPPHPDLVMNEYLGNIYVILLLFWRHQYHLFQNWTKIYQYMNFLKIIP